MKKWLMCGIGAVLCSVLMSVIPAHAEMAVSEDGLWQFDENDNGELTVTLLDKTVTEATVPSEYHGTPVTVIAVDGFYGCENLRSVTLPDTITNIEDYAFYMCPALEELHIPDTVTKIGFMAFYGCASLKEMDIPVVTEEIELFAFEGCSSLSAVRVANGNTHYKDEDGILFDYDGTTLILYPSEKKDTDYTIPEGCTRIEDYAFIGNTYLKSVNIDNITELGEDAFYFCTSLEQMTIPDAITELNGSVFGMCQSLRSVTLPPSLTTIGSSCFYGCISLPEISIPESVTSIREYAFFNCPALSSITLTKNVETIGDYALGYYYSEGEEPSRLPGFVVDAANDTAAFSYCAKNSIKCTGGVTQGTVFIYIILAVIALIIIATIVLIVVQKRIQKRYELN